MALDTILEKLHEERDRLTKELNRVVKMIRAAGKGVQAAVQEYGRRTPAKDRKRAPAKKKLSAATLAKMKKAQRESRARDTPAAKATHSPKRTAPRNRQDRTPKTAAARFTEPPESSSTRWTASCLTCCNKWSGEAGEVAPLRWPNSMIRWADTTLPGQSTCNRSPTLRNCLIFPGQR